GVAAVVDVVAAGHGDVDAADVGDVLRRGVAVPDDDGLLVVAAHRGYAVVEQHPPAAAGDRPGEGPVLRGRVAQQRAVGAPQQAADDGAAAARGGEHLTRRGVVEPLLGVGAPPGEEDEVAVAGGVDRVLEGGEVGPAVGQ